MDIIEIQFRARNLGEFFHRVEELRGIELIVAHRILAGLGQRSLGRGHQTVHGLAVVLPVEPHDIDHGPDAHRAQGEDHRQGDQQGDLALERVLGQVEQLVFPPAYRKQQQEDTVEDGQIGERDQVREEGATRPRNDRNVLIRKPVDKVHVAVFVDHRVTDLVAGRRHDGIDVAAAVGDQALVGIARIGILAREGGRRPGARGESVERIGDHIVLVFRLQLQEQARDLIIGRIEIGEHADIGRQAVVVVQIVDVGSGRQRDTVVLDHILVKSEAAHRFGPLPQRDQVAGRAGGERDVVFAHHVAVEVALHQAVLDELGPAHGRKDRQERVALDGGLHLPEEHLERQVPLDSQLAGVDAVALVFLIEAVHIDGEHAVERNGQGVRDKVGPGEEVDPCVAADEHHHHINLVEQRQEEHRKGQVGHEGVRPDRRETVRLHHDAGVAQQRPHHEMDVGHQRKAGQGEEHHDGPAVPRRTELHRPVDAVAHHEERIEGKGDGDIVEQQAAQRIEERRVGIEHRREEFPGGKSFPDVIESQQAHCGQRQDGEPESAPGMIAVMVRKDSKQHQDESQPAQVHVAVSRRRRYGPDDREQRLVLDAVHDGGIVVVDGQRRIIVFQVQVRIDGIGNGAAGILRLDEDARDHLDPAVILEVGGDHIPGAAQIDIFLLHADVGQRRRIEIAVAHELEPVGIGIDVHLVVADGELVRPALHRIGLIAVEHDVVRQVVEIHPVLVHGLERAVGILLRQQLPFVERTLHAVLLPAQPRLVVGPDAGEPQQDQRDSEKDETAVPQQEAAQTQQIWFDSAHSW